MRRLRGLLRRLDPWTALLLGGLVAMAVVILLATPGPWQRVVGPDQPVAIASPPPQDVAVFVDGAASQCAGVVWLHVDYRRPALTAVVVPALTQGYVPGGGFAPLARLADDLGPAAAAAALGEAVGTGMDAWVSLDRKAFLEVLAPLFPDVATAGRPRTLLGAAAAWDGTGRPERVWYRQYQSLRRALPQLAFEQMNVIAFTNYVLGFGHVSSDLDLQGATSLGRAVQGLTADAVTVTAVPAIVETCRGAEWWRLDLGSAEQLRLSLAFDVAPPEAGAVVVRRRRQARVLVVLPDSMTTGDAYAAGVSHGLRLAGALDVGVDLVTVGPDGEGLDDAVAARRPLAVLLGTALDAGDGTGVGQGLRAMGETLRVMRQPAVIAGPPDGDAVVTAAAQAAGPPVSVAVTGGASPATDGAPLSAAAARRLGRAHAATLARACWPGVLAPGQQATRAGFAFAARPVTGVLVIGRAGEDVTAPAARLHVWGWTAAIAGEEGQQPADAAGVLFFRPDARRAALALAGDLRLPASRVVATEDAPAPLTVVWPPAL